MSKERVLTFSLYLFVCNVNVGCIYRIVYICMIFVYLLVVMFFAADYMWNLCAFWKVKYLIRSPEVLLFQLKDECPRLAKELIVWKSRKLQNISWF